MLKKLLNQSANLLSAIQWKKLFGFLMAVLLLSLIIYLGYLAISRIWDEFLLLEREISLALLTAFTTVFVATLTLVLGKNYDRKKEIEAHYRQKKTEIYDEFLKEFFNAFHSVSVKPQLDEPEVNDSGDLVTFLREWQRKIILWGGADVVTKYSQWMEYLKEGHADAKTMYMTEDFFLSIRRDLGHSNANIPKGTFIRFMLRNGDLFLSLSSKNQNITLHELAEIEALLEKNKGE